jgi:3-oxoacyl-[acyl-carrier protein] reductase
MSDGGLDLLGRTAVVTGSTHGIGRAIALELATAGADVVIHGRDEKAGQAVCEEIRTIGQQTTFEAADFVDPQQQDDFVGRVFAWRDDIDIWINNAGHDALTGAAAAASFEEKLDTLWRVDVLATVRISRDVGHRWLDREDSNIPCLVNVGWDQAEIGMGGDSGEMFSTIKGAVMAFTRSLAITLAPKVRVNCLAPGWIKTAWGRQASRAWQDRARGESLLKRWGEPNDVARAAHFLVSPAAEFITGQTLPINGGQARRSGTE